MTDLRKQYRLSPNVASNRAHKAFRTRMKALRLDDSVDPQREFAGRIVSLLQAASADNPGEWSDAYTEHVVNRFADKYVELCRVAPVQARQP
jgi:hypothetical protein